MLLIKYFKNTKAICLETQESFAEGPSPQKTPIAGNGRQTEPPAGGKHSAKLCARSLPISDDLVTCTSSWLDSGTCTCMHRKEVYVHSLESVWNPKSAGPPETSSSTLPLPGRVSLVECWNHSDHLRREENSLCEQQTSKSSWHPVPQEQFYYPRI